MSTKQFATLIIVASLGKTYQPCVSKNTAQLSFGDSWDVVVSQGGTLRNQLLPWLNWDGRWR